MAKQLIIPLLEGKKDLRLKLKRKRETNYI